MLIFETPRLRLRPLDAGDEALYCQLYTDPEVMRHVGAPLSAEAARSAFQKSTRLMQQAMPTLQLWVLSERDSSVDIGILAVMRHGPADTLEIGAMLVTAGQGRGLSVEAQTALLDWVFDAQGVGMVWSRNAPGNSAASGVRLKLGFLLARGGQGDTDEVYWQMSRERWNAGRLARNGKT